MSLIDIARSGVLSYRTALSVTAENIANVNTEGYIRRDATMVQVPGARATATSGATSGQGVRIEDIRRAFDGLLAERLRSAGSAATSAEAQSTSAARIEQLFLSGTGSIPEALETFFDTVNSLAANPSDRALRQVVMAAGTDLADSVAQVATGLTRLRGDVLAEAAVTADQVNSQLKQLADLQARMTGSSQASLNPMLDERDRLLTSLSESVGISVSYDGVGRARVTLGASAGGPVLLDGSDRAQVGIGEAGGMVVTLTRGGQVQQSRQLTGGALQGLGAALGAVDSALAELDSLARQMAGDMNAVHRQGLDLTGAAGGDLFRLDGFAVTASPVNRGAALAEVVASTGQATGAVTLVRDETAGLWRALDAGGTEIGSGAETITLPGMTLRLSGTAMDGDRLTVTPTTGKALNMRFVPTKPEQIAAAAATLVSAGPSNTGNAVATITPLAPDAPGIALLDGFLGAGASNAVSLLQDGVVGYVPAGTTALSLASLGTQSSLDFLLSAAQAEGATQLAFTAGGTARSFDLSGFTGDAAALAAALNDGSLRSAEGLTLAQTGIRAAAGGGRLTLALGSGSFGGGAVTGPGVAVTGSASPSEPAGGTIQIITRDGRHIAGTPLSAEQVATLLTEANGFLPGAASTYNADYLVATDGTGYRGMTVDATTLPGQFALSLTLGQPAVWSGAIAAPARPAQVLSIGTGIGLPVEVTLPQGSSARRAASVINEALDGIEAQATTRVELTVPADGRLSFRLAGTNMQPLTVGGDVVGGRMDGLAQAINAVSSTTGITADLSPDGTRLQLVHAGGEDISLSGVSHSGGATASLRATDEAGRPRGSAVDLGAGADGARFTGQVRLNGGAGFAATLDGTRQEAAPDPLLGGLVERTVASAGSEHRLVFQLDAGLDGGSTSTDGLASAAASARYTLSLGGRQVTLDAGAAGITSAAGVAEGLAALLREEAPTATLTGRALAALPAEGASLTVLLDGQSHVLRMTGGSIEVDGGTGGALTASFDAQNRLQVSTAAGSLDGSGITVQGGATAAFGLAAGDAPTTSVTGQPVVAADLPPGGAQFSVEVGGTAYDLTVTAAGAGVAVATPPGFPGSASQDPATGRIILTLPATAGPIRIPPDQDAATAGFVTQGATLAVTGGELVLTSTTGAALNVAAGAEALAGQRLDLANLPPEDLIVAMTGSGSLRLAGAMQQTDQSALPPAVEVRVTDAATGQIELFDSATGHSIGTRTLGADGSVTLGGFHVTLSGTPATGDSFFLTPNSGTAGGEETLGRLLDLRSADPATGRGGFTRIYTEIQSAIGMQAHAAEGRVTSTAAGREGAERAFAAASAVDLDAEAARLMEQQQAYQASSQVLSVAKTLFETLLNSL